MFSAAVDSSWASFDRVRVHFYIRKLKERGRQRQRQRKRRLKIYLYFICATSRLFQLAQLLQ